MGYRRFLIGLILLGLVGHVGAQISGGDSDSVSLDRNGEAVRLSWGGKSGTTFFPQHSASLTRWGYLNDLFFGEGVHHKEVSEDPARQFFRICSIEAPIASREEAYVADFDQDGLANKDEIGTVGSDPLLADSDGDGLPDGWEVVHQLNPLDDGTMDPDRAPDAAFGGIIASSEGPDVLESPGIKGQFLSNRDAFNMGVQAKPAAGPEDLDGEWTSQRR